MRKVECTQSVDAQNWKPRFDRWLDIGSVERPGFRRVMEHLHRDLKCLIDVCHWSAHVDDQAIGKCVRNFQAMRLRETDHPLIVDDGGTELVRELLYGEKAPVVRTGWIIELLQ